MEIEELQKAWQNQNSPARLAMDTSRLLQEVESDRRHFNRRILWRDFRETGVCFALVAFFCRSAMKSHAAELFVPAVACAGVAVFILADRRRSRKSRPLPGSTVRANVEASLAGVTHQIWLLHNVFWWYLLPLGLAVEICFGVSAWRLRHLGPWRGLAPFLGLSAGSIVLYAGIHRLNQRAVTKGLEPRRKELEDCLSRLDE